MEQNEFSQNSTDFLQYICKQKLSPSNLTEEIYKEETKNFCQRMANKLTSPKSLSPISKLTKKLMSNLKLSERLRSKLEGNRNKSPILPPLKTIITKNTNSYIHSLNVTPLKQGRRKYSISKILSLYKEGVEKSATTKNLKRMAMRDSFVAREYAKEILKTSEILKEVNEFQNQMKKELYQELKSSTEDYESEKTQIIKDFTRKLVLKKNYKLKNLTNFKPRPKIL